MKRDFLCSHFVVPSSNIKISFEVLSANDFLSAGDSFTCWSSFWGRREIFKWESAVWRLAVCLGVRLTCYQPRAIVNTWVPRFADLKAKIILQICSISLAPPCELRLLSFVFRYLRRVRKLEIIVFLFRIPTSAAVFFSAMLIQTFQKRFAATYSN